MIRALLLDLDDTLLGNKIDVFMARYFAMLRDYARPVLDEATFLPHLIQATQAAIRNPDPELTNADVLWTTFEQLGGAPREDVEPFFARFYETEFPRLRALTERRPAAAKLMRAAFAHELGVVIATNPLFPRTAIEQRLDWAGIPVDEYPYALVTTYETMHAAKPQPAYYREILAIIDCPAEAALMVGDNWRNDIAPAAALGLHTYWINTDGTAAPEPAFIDGRGSLDDLVRLIANGWLERVTPTSIG